MRAVLRFLRWPLFALGVITLVAGLLIALNPGWIRVEAVQIELAPDSKEFLLYQRIRSSLAPRLRRFEGQYFWEVPLNGVYEVAAQDRRVKRVTVRREFPVRLRLEVEPHTPVLDYISKDGRVYPLATDATLLPAHTLADSSNLPFLRGEELKDQAPLREAAIQLYSGIPEEGFLSRKTVSEIYYSKKSGFSLFVGGAASEVKIGDSDFGPKISRVQKVLSYLDSQGVKGRVIDARFSKKVVVRVRKAP